MNNPNGPAANYILSERVRLILRPITDWIGQAGVRLGINPDWVTAFGLLIVLVAAWQAASGNFLLAAVILVIGAPFDMIDGAIARAMNRKNPFGAFLDSTLDRFADAFLFFGVSYYFAAQGQLVAMSITIVALIGAFGVSYIRARAEGLGIGSIKDGWFDRSVRMVVFILTLLTGWILPGMLLLAVGAYITVFQRGFIIYQMTAHKR
jgi:CDP-diacylglycerol---glycerol-3-phosphate 3-phosphatidyltransferase